MSNVLLCMYDKPCYRPLVIASINEFEYITINKYMYIYLYFFVYTTPITMATTVSTRAPLTTPVMVIAVIEIHVHVYICINNMKQKINMKCPKLNVEKHP